MDRRTFITMAAAGVASATQSRAQQPGRTRRLGFLIYSTPQQDRQMQAVLEGLRDLGYDEGRNLFVDVRFAEGRLERLPDLADELVRLKPEVLVGLGGDVAPFLHKASKSIPIVFVISADPLKLGLVSSIARPDGNATGFTFLQDELASKRLEYLKEVAPRIARVGFLYNPDHPDDELVIAQQAAAALGVRLLQAETRGSADLDAAFGLLSRSQVDSLYVVSSRQTVASIPRIVDFAISSSLPLAGSWGLWVQAGGLLSFGPNVTRIARQSAAYIDKIFRQTRIGDLPVQRPTRFELQLNLRSAKALGLSVPEAFLMRADGILE